MKNPGIFYTYFFIKKFYDNPGYYFTQEIKKV